MPSKISTTSSVIWDTFIKMYNNCNIKSLDMVKFISKLEKDQKIEVCKIPDIQPVIVLEMKSSFDENIDYKLTYVQDVDNNVINRIKNRVFDCKSSLYKYNLYGVELYPNKPHIWAFESFKEALQGIIINHFSVDKRAYISLDKQTDINGINTNDVWGIVSSGDLPFLLLSLFDKFYIRNFVKEYSQMSDTAWFDLLIKVKEEEPEIFSLVQKHILSVPKVASVAIFRDLRLELNLFDDE